MLAECKTLEAPITSSDASRSTSFPECYDAIATGSSRLQNPPWPFLFFHHLHPSTETGNPNGIFGPSDSVFGPSKSPFGPQGMSFPGMPDSAETTPGGGYKNEGY